MQRISLVEKDQAHPIVQKLYESNETRWPKILNLFKVMGHCPYIGLNFQRLGSSILRGEELPANWRELAILRVGYLTQSEYEFTQHTRIGLNAGVRQEQIDGISDWAASTEFDEQERAILRYTDEVVRDIKVKDETFAGIRDFLSEHAVVELTTVIGYYCMVSRILVALQVELETD